MEKVLQLELTKEETRKRPTTRATPAFKLSIPVACKKSRQKLHPWANRHFNTHEIAQAMHEYNLMTNAFFIHAIANTTLLSD